MAIHRKVTFAVVGCMGMGLSSISPVNAFTSSLTVRQDPWRGSGRVQNNDNVENPLNLLCRRYRRSRALAVSSSTEESDVPKKAVKTKTPQDLAVEEEVAKRTFAISTKYGALNLFGIYYGLVSIVLGFVWYFATMSYVFFSWITRGKFDKNKRIPIWMAHVWGTLLLRFTRCMPTIENSSVLNSMLNNKRAGMFVANHNSWMDIPFLGRAIGWRNYKMVAKQELQKVPILGTCMTASGHVLLSRKDRRSQMRTLKSGIDWLQRGVHLCTFPEGTRSKTGRLLPFKNGAFKMAYKAGAPVVPVSIVNSGVMMPPGWMFPMMAGHKVGKVIVHEPIESEGITEDELATKVREAIISGLPESQRPKE